jgi:TonB family protein
MMRLWKDSYARRTPIGGPAAASTMAHAVIIAAWVVATLPAASMAVDSIANHIFYIPPPDRAPTRAGAVEVVHYVSVTDGLLIGPGPASFDASKLPTGALVQSSAGGAPKEADTAAVATPAGNSDHTQDSVFTILEVDTAVVRSASSAAPAYPLDLFKQRVEGRVRVRYVVDTTGFADPTSLEVVESSHPAFLASVRDVLPYMRFTPAKIGSKKVRQMVEQPFSFHIQDAPVKAKP